MDKFSMLVEAEGLTGKKQLWLKSSKLIDFANKFRDRLFVDEWFLQALGLRPDLTCGGRFETWEDIDTADKEYPAGSYPKHYGILDFVEKSLRVCDLEQHENIVGNVPFFYIKIGNPTREVYGELYKKYTNDAARERRKNSRQERIRQVLYSRICLAMSELRKRRNNSSLKKAGSAVKDLGCTLEFLEKHIEGKFQEGMSWDNYGEWEIDHIYPLSKLDLTNPEEFSRACHYTNLQPLWWQDNLKKKNHIT